MPYLIGGLETIFVQVSACKGMFPKAQCDCTMQDWGHGSWAAYGGIQLSSMHITRGSAFNPECQIFFFLRALHKMILLH